MRILEKKYRGSLICRIVGYPISYAIAKMLLENGPMALEEFVKRVKRSKATVCIHLAKLKLADFVRYEKKGHKTVYWIKYPKAVAQFMQSCKSWLTELRKASNKIFNI